MFAQSTRPLTPEERAQFDAQREELRRQMAAAAVDDRRNSREAATRFAFVPAFFLAVVIFNLVSGSKSAALAALAGVIIFTGVVIWILRPNIDSPIAKGEIELLSLTLDANTVLVYEIRAELAIAIGPPEPADEIWGDVLQVGPDKVVYVSRRTCSGVDPERLPNTALYVERAVPFDAVKGVAKVEPRGARIATALRVRLPNELLGSDQIPAALAPIVPVELLPCSGDVAALALSLPAAAAAESD